MSISPSPMAGSSDANATTPLSQSSKVICRLPMAVRVPVSFATGLRKPMPSVWYSTRSRVSSTTGPSPSSQCGFMSSP